MIFYALTFCWALREVLKPDLKGEGFNTSRGAQRMLMYQKSMFDHYYCIKHFFHSKLWRNCFKKLFLPVPIIVRKSTLPANVLKMPLPGQRSTSSLLCTLLWWRQFYDGPGMLIRKTAKRCSNSTWISLLNMGVNSVQHSFLCNNWPYQSFFNWCDRLHQLAINVPRSSELSSDNDFFADYL